MSKASSSKRRPKPKLPLQQLVILAVARFSEPLALSSVFPYLPEMIQGFGIAKDDVAYWAGVTSAVFSLAQASTAVPWGRASDTFGRKPTIIMGLFSTMVCFLAWGLSTSLPMAIIARAIQGGGNGNVGIIRTMVAEMVPEKELQPVAFSLMPLVWSLGSIFGPAFGGFFAKPATQFPSLFGGVPFWEKYPFALPNIVGAVFFLASMTTAALFLKETLEHKKNNEDWGLLLGRKLTRSFKSARGQRRASFVDGEATAPLVPTKPVKPKKRWGQAARPGIKEVFTQQTTIGLVSYTFLALHSVAYDQILPVFLNYPVLEHTPENTSLPFRFSGGFGLGSGRIGSIFTFYGITCGLIQFIIFPPLCTRLGSQRLIRICSVLFPVVYLITPYTVLLENPTMRYAALLSVMLLKAAAVIIGFPCMTILLTNSCASLRILGTLNGFATTFSALGRAFGPAVAGAAFSWGVGKGYIITAWYFLALMSIIGAIPTWFLVDGEGPGRSTESSDAEDEPEDDDSAVILDSAIASDDDDEYASDSAPLLRGRRETGYGSSDSN
ncbi:related to E.coli tetracycline resistance protein TCR1 [Cephalotrichum gorgonifer]|uniref:Related to E.coli tetracycline resistance protein TCR1 n=1 Tax=Cephalotrichum gorgonifer TaxID=2041049 RepID=A0AAE8N7E3_9PEZI|nr:related to E.coli tetracycline resistance protein TCR1 [Cephalotrichum gorgonifer]